MYGLAIRSPVPSLRSQSVSCSAGFPNEIRVVSRVALELNRPPGSPRTNPLGGAPLVELYDRLPPDAVKIILVLFLSFLIGLEREDHKAKGGTYSFGGDRKSTRLN